MESIEFVNRNGQITFKADLPTSWDEVTNKQFKSIFKLLYSSGFSKPEIQKSQLRILEILLNPKRNKKKLKDILNLHENSMYDLLKVIDFVFNTFPTKVFIPSVRVGLTRYYLPDSDLANAVMIEYTYADKYLSCIPASDTDEDFNKLIACLCRPSKWFWWIQKLIPKLNDGDRREQFNPTIMLPRANKFKNLPIELKYMIFYYFVGCKQNILKSYDLLFPEKKEGEPPGEVLDWLEVIQDVAKTNLYGNYDATAYYPLHTVLYNLNSEQKRLKK